MPQKKCKSQPVELLKRAIAKITAEQKARVEAEEKSNAYTDEIAWREAEAAEWFRFGNGLQSI